jgi:hypothetical protein
MERHIYYEQIKNLDYHNKTMAYEFIDEPVSNSYEFIDEPIKKQTIGQKIVQ